MCSLRLTPSCATGTCCGSFWYASSAARSRNIIMSPVSYDRGDRTMSSPTFRSTTPSNVLRAPSRSRCWACAVSLVSRLYLKHTICRSMCNAPSELLALDFVVRHVDDEAMDVDAEPLPERLQIAGLRPRRLVIRPRGELKLEQPGRVFLHPFQHVFFQLELGQQVRGAVRLRARDRHDPAGCGGLVAARPVDVGLRANDGNRGAVDHAHGWIVYASRDLRL